MGIVAAQCRVFIAQNDICAPRRLYTDLFFLDNRRIPASSPSRRLPDSLLFPSILPPFHVPSRPASSLDPLHEPPGGSSRRRFRLTQAFRHRLSGVSCAIPSGFPLVFSSVFRLLSPSLQSKSACEGRFVSSHVVCLVPSFRSPFRFPACRAERVACRGVWRGERRDVLWNVSHETWALPRAFLDAV